MVASILLACKSEAPGPPKVKHLQDFQFLGLIGKKTITSI